MKTNTHKLVLMSLYIAISLVLSWLETMVPIPFPIPGAKLGLANIVTLLALLTLSPLETLLILVSRIFLSGFLFGSFASILYALAGGLFSFLVMLLLKKTGQGHIAIPVISIMGAVAHNTGQLVVAALVTQTPSLFVFYWPPLILIAIPVGLLTGIMVKTLYAYLKRSPSFQG